MSRCARWCALVCLVVLGAATPVAAQSNPDLDIRIERDNRPRPYATDLVVYHLVTLTERATGQPPQRAYPLYAQAKSQQGEQTEIFDCHHASDDDPRIPKGQYHCTIYLDHGGPWEFVATVGDTRDGVPVTVATAGAPFVLDTNQVYTGDDPEADQVKGSTGAVAFLWAHVLVAAAWFACVAALAALAIPELRARLSIFGLHYLEDRFDRLVKLTWSATGALIGSGIWLLAKETAYDTPVSTSELDALFALPYAKPYFLSLGVKLGLYALMVLAVIPLVRGADRQRHAEVVRARHESLVEPTPTPGGDTLLAPPLEAPAAATTPALLGRLAAVYVLIGTVGISLCVTLMKYFHQLIEAS